MFKNIQEHHNPKHHIKTQTTIMSEEREYRRHQRSSGKKTSVWLIIGVIVLIVLLVVWLTVAMFTGDTDVNAAPVEDVAGMIMPLLV